MKTTPKNLPNHSDRNTDGRFDAPRITRRSFLGRSLGAGAALGLASARGGSPSAEAGWLNTALSPEEGFTIVGIPDVHVDFMCTGERLATVSEWIVARAQHLNIRYVAQLGDAGDRRGSGSHGEMLATSRRGFEPIVRAGIPLSVCIGNHDYDRASNARINNEWNREEAFGMSLYQNAPGFGGTFESESDDPGPDPGGTVNHYFTFEAAGVKMLMLCLELGPREKVMKWADHLVRNRFPDHSVMAFTHSYLDTDSLLVDESKRGNPKRYAHFSTEEGPEYTHDGKDMWERYLRHWPNLRMVHSGHSISGPRQAWLDQSGENGNKVAGLYYNWQEWGYDAEKKEMIHGLSVEHGASMIRLFQIRPAAKSVHIANFLPSAGVEADPSFPESLPWA